MGVLPRAPLIGRAEELAALRHAVTSSWERRTTTVVLRGAAGIGKTRLVSELVSSIPENQCRVVTGTCSAMAGRELPWAPWVDVVRDVRRQCGDDPVSSLLSGRIAALGPLAPGMASPSGPQGHRSRAEVFGAVADLMIGAAESRPILLVLEDVQWADDDSLGLLLHLARSSHTDPLAVVVTVRSEDPAYEHVRERLSELERMSRAVRIDLAALDALEVAAQSEHLAGRRLDPSLMSRIIELSGGVPLFVEELVAAVRRDGGTLTTRPLQERLLRLTPRARTVVDALALAVVSPSPPVLLRASGLTDEDFDAAVLESRAAAVLVTAGGPPVFRHALLRETALGLVRPRRARELHGAWARAWETVPDDPDRLLEQMVATAHHWRAAEEPAAALDAFLNAAELARQRSAYPVRSRLLQDAARLWQKVPDAQERLGRDRAALLADAAEAASAAFCDPGQALELLAQAREALAESAPREQSARLAWLEVLEADFRHVAAEHRSAEETLVRLAAIPREPPTPEWVRAASQAAMVLQQAGRPEEGEPYARDAVVAARALGDPAVESGATALLAFSELQLGRGAEALRLARAATRLAERTRDPRALHDSLGALGVVRWHLGDLEGCRDVIRRELELLGGEEPAALPSEWALQRTNLAELCLDFGDWDEAERLLRSVLVRQDTPPWVRGFADRLTRHLRTWRGTGGQERQPCGDRCEGLDTSDLQDLVPSRYTDADAAAYHGDLAGVRACVRDLLGDQRIALLSPVALPLLEVVVRAEAEWATAGRADPDPSAGAWTIDRVRHLLTLVPAGNARARAYFAHVEAELARREGRDDAAMWSEVVLRWRETPIPHPLARALVRLAEAAEREGRRATAAAALDEALLVTRRLGAEPLRQAALLLGQRAARSAPGRAAAPGQRLSTREREVLQLLAGGASNAAIAERLVISQKTVAVHVSHIMQKLDAPSRGAAVATALRLGIASVEETPAGA